MSTNTEHDVKAGGRWACRPFFYNRSCAPSSPSLIPADSPSGPIHFLTKGPLDGRLTNAEEDKGLHAQELLLGDVERAEPLREQLHAQAVLVHRGELHPLAAGRAGEETLGCATTIIMRKTVRGEEVGVHLCFCFFCNVEDKTGRQEESKGKVAHKGGRRQLVVAKGKKMR